MTYNLLLILICLLSSSASPAAAEGLVFNPIRSLMNGGFCMDAKGGNKDGTPPSGTQLQIWNCSSGNTNQLFDYDSNTGQIYLSNSASSLCVADSGYNWISGQSGTLGLDGNYVQIVACGAGAEQKWSLDSSNGEIINQFNGKCLDVTHENNRSGTPLQIWSCAGAPNQQWSFANSPAGGGTITAYMTSADQSHLLSPQENLSFSATRAFGQYVIHLNEDIHYQQMVGFGASITDGTAWLLSHALSKSSADSLMTKLFDPDLGIGLSFLRQPIGATDLSASVYSYEDTRGQFSIAHDMTAMIPLVKQALALNPKLQVMGSPWSPPAWMQDNNSMFGGTLLAEHQENFSQYLVKAVQAWQEQGIPVHAISMQNEPRYINDGYPTAGMSLFPGDSSWPTSPVDHQSLLKNHVGPAFAHAGLSTKFLVLDHNWDHTSQVMNMLSDPETRRYSHGVAFHCYGGNILDSAAVQQSYPSVDLYSTECSSGSWRSWSDQFSSDASSWIIGTIRLGSKSIVKWGLVLDDNHAPHLETGGCKECIGAAVVHNNADGSYTGTWDLERDYYTLGQISKFVQPGAYRIESDQSNDSVIQDIAFLNPDGTKALYVYNSSSSPQTFAVQASLGSFRFFIPAQSVVTFKW
jgi:glucosylceramidase